MNDKAKSSENGSKNHPWNPSTRKPKSSNLENISINLSSFEDTSISKIYQESYQRCKHTLHFYYMCVFFHLFTFSFASFQLTIFEMLIGVEDNLLDNQDATSSREQPNHHGSPYKHDKILISTFGEHIFSLQRICQSYGWEIKKNGFCQCHSFKRFHNKFVHQGQKWFLIRENN